MSDCCPPAGILETVLCAEDLGAIEAFYSDVQHFQVFSRRAGRQVFYRCGDQLFLIFKPSVTTGGLPDRAAPPIPPHGASGPSGPGHVCFRALGPEIDTWKVRLLENGVSIEADFDWPQGGRSIYFLNPAGNCPEFAEPRIWGLT